MAMCQVTRKAFMSGHRVSHSNVKTKRRKKVNVQKKRIYDLETGRFVRVKLSTRALRTTNKRPIALLLREGTKA
ncbi:MAG: 50S ribosomal protein L28 [Myxococcota bacterium]